MFQVRNTSCEAFGNRNQTKRARTAYGPMVLKKPAPWKAVFAMPCARRLRLEFGGPRRTGPFERSPRPYRGRLDDLDGRSPFVWSEDGSSEALTSSCEIHMATRTILDLGVLAGLPCTQVQDGPGICGSGPGPQNECVARSAHSEHRADGVSIFQSLGWFLDTPESRLCIDTPWKMLVYEI